MRFLFVGGGTGGHLTPAIGLAEGLEAKGHETLFLLSGRAVESAYMETDRAYYGLGFEPGRGPKTLRLMRCAWRARRHARRFRPHAVIALGGASSAAALGIPAAPLVLLEGNYVVGRSVRWMAGFSALCLTMFEDTAKQLKRAQAIGPVMRRDLAAVAVDEARRRLGLQPQLPTLLVLGGSQGAAQLNQLAQALAPKLHQLGWQMLVLSGPGKSATLAQAVDSWPVVVQEHCAQMGLAYSAADFVLSRGGASTIGELWLHALPAAILPYPWHRDRQQERNAEALVPGFLNLAACPPAEQEARLLQCLQDAEKREAMARALRLQRPADGQAKGVELLEEIALQIP